MASGRTASGLFINGALVARQVSLDLHIEPSVGVLARNVDKLGANIRSFREPLRRMIKNVMIPSIRQNFDSSGRPGWVPLSEFTLKRKAAKGQGSQPLIGTGALRRVMGQINVWHIDQEKALILDLPGNIWYGKVHQAGYTGGAGAKSTTLRNVTTGKTTKVQDFGSDVGIPARPYIMVQEDDIDKMERIMSEWVAERVRKAGLG